MVAINGFSFGFMVGGLGVGLFTGDFTMAIMGAIGFVATISSCPYVRS